MARGNVNPQQKVDASRYAMIPRNDVPRSAFDMVHQHKTTFYPDVLVPVYVDEILPGDSVKLKMTAFCRLATPLVPVMDNLYLESFFFFVPNRLLWTNWERFMGELASPTDTTQFLLPYLTIRADEMQDAADPHTLADWFGITLNGAVAATTINVNALPFRAYAFIWNEWFRDQDLDTLQPFPTDDGPDTYAADYAGAYVFELGLLRRKRADYFTTCRPWPQKPINAAAVSGMTAGAPWNEGVGGGTWNAITGTSGFMAGQAGAPVSGLGILQGAVPTVGAVTVNTSGAHAFSTAAGESKWISSDDPFYMRASGSNLYPDVKVLINDLRVANQMQLFMERNARGGSRYTEIIRSHFGVISPDARLQRPEYLGGGRSHVTINPLAQTSATGIAGTTTVLGELAGIGTALAVDHGFSQSFTEHGVLIGLVNVRTDLTYQQGINRMWFRRTQFDFYFPATAHLGEQAVQSREIYANGTLNDDIAVFGYQERWGEYRQKPSRISGVFRSSFATPIDMWHLAEEFAGRPSLNSDFIESSTPIDRALQVDTVGSASFLLDCLFHVRMVRCMPMFSIPGMGPHL